MIFYSWVAVSGSARTAAPVAMGITDDRARAIKAGEETLGSGRASMVIIEVVRPGMAAHTLALNPEAEPLRRALHDKHFLRKHGATAYYGQTKRDQG